MIGKWFTRVTSCVRRMTCAPKTTVIDSALECFIVFCYGFFLSTCSPDLQEHILSLTNNAAILMNTKKPAVSGSIPGIGPRTGMPSSIPGLQGTMGNPVSNNSSFMFSI